MSDNSDSESDEDYVPEDDVDESVSGSDDEATAADDRRGKETKNNCIEGAAQKSVDELWSEFLQDTGTSVSTSAKIPVERTNEKTGENGTANVTTQNSNISNSSSKKIVTEIYEFAGEEVKVTKEVDSNSEDSQPNLACTSAEDSESPSSERVNSQKRPAGLSGVLSQIGKKQKLGTFQKSKLDWDGFKKSENIEEELAQHNRGRGGFIEKQDFLQRADYRQFEIERDLRMSKRKN